jgi:hypothetical protein
MDLFVFFYNYTNEMTSSTLQGFSCLLNSLRLTASQLRLTVSHITLLVCKLLYLLGNTMNLEASVANRIFSPSHLLERRLSLVITLIHFLASGKTNRDRRLQGFQQSFFKKSLPWICMCPKSVATIIRCRGTCFTSRCLAMTVFSDSTIPAFRRHFTVCYKICII